MFHTIGRDFQELGEGGPNLFRDACEKLEKDRLALDKLRVVQLECCPTCRQAFYKCPSCNAIVGATSWMHGILQGCRDMPQVCFSCQNKNRMSDS